MPKAKSSQFKFKKLKRYQYERYAILCQLVYPQTNNEFELPDNQYQMQAVADRFGRTIAKILWQCDKEEAIVVFRGSQFLFGWLINLAFWPKTIKLDSCQYRVHAGYQFLLEQYSDGKTSQSVRLSVEDAIMQKLDVLIEQGKRISLIGHSSGGAMAVLLADRIERCHPKKVKRVVTFGQPSVGLYHFKQRYLLHRKTYRICCDLDVVTFLPPLPLIYWHVGRLLWLHDDKIYENTQPWYRFSKSLLSWLLLPFTYHYMRKYIRNKDLFDKH